MASGANPLGHAEVKFAEIGHDTLAVGPGVQREGPDHVGVAAPPVTAAFPRGAAWVHWELCMCAFFIY